MAFATKQPVTERGRNTADPNTAALEIAFDFLDGSGTDLDNQGVDNTDIPKAVQAGAGGTWGSLYGGSFDMTGSQYFAWTNATGSHKEYASGTIVTLFRVGAAADAWYGLFATGAASPLHKGSINVQYIHRDDGLTDDEIWLTMRCEAGQRIAKLTGVGILASGIDHIVRAEWTAAGMKMILDGTSAVMSGYDATPVRIRDGQTLHVGADDGLAGMIEMVNWCLYSVDVSADVPQYGFAMSDVLDADPLVPIRRLPFESHSPYCYKAVADGVTVRMLQQRNWSMPSQFQILHAIDDATLDSDPTTRDAVTAASVGSGTPIALEDAVTGLAANQRFQIQYRWQASGAWVDLGLCGRTDTPARGNLKSNPAVDAAETVVAIISDLHTFQQSHASRLPSLNASLTTHAPDAIIDLGDKEFGPGNHVDSNDTAFDWNRKTADAYASIFREACFFPDDGNHEGIADYMSTVYRDPLRISQPLFFPGNGNGSNVHNWHHRIGPIHIFAICHYVGTGHEGEGALSSNGDRVMSAAALAWLVAAIDASTASYKVVVSHQLVGGYNPYGRGFLTDVYAVGNPDPETITYMESTLWPAIKDKIDVWIQGHDHACAWGRLDGVLHVEACSPLCPAQAGGTPVTGHGYDDANYAVYKYGWVKLVATPSNLWVEFIQSLEDDGVTPSNVTLWSLPIRAGSNPGVRMTARGRNVRTRALRTSALRV